MKEEWDEITLWALAEELSKRMDAVSAGHLHRRNERDIQVVDMDSRAGTNVLPFVRREHRKP